MKRERHYKITELPVVINLEDCLLSLTSSRLYSIIAFFIDIFLILQLSCHLLVFALAGRKLGLMSRTNVIERAKTIASSWNIHRLGSRKTTSCLRHGCSYSCCYTRYTSVYKSVILAKSCPALTCKYTHEQIYTMGVGDYSHSKGG